MDLDHDRLETILVAALEIESETERQEYIVRSCGGDVVLQARVVELIKSHLQAGSFLVASNRSSVEAKAVQEQPGSMIGPYKLLQKIGLGGMGVVFLAEQLEPVRRQVAIKMIRAEMDSAQIVARFELERRSLAVMDHPNIARVIDGGLSDNGRTYFAMEFIHGIPITEYCDQHRLNPRQRMELMIPICHAIQHAHQKGLKCHR